MGKPWMRLRGVPGGERADNTLTKQSQWTALGTEQIQVASRHQVGSENRFLWDSSPRCRSWIHSRGSIRQPRWGRTSYTVTGLYSSKTPVVKHQGRRKHCSRLKEDKETWKQSPFAISDLIRQLAKPQQIHNQILFLTRHTHVFFFSCFAFFLLHRTQSDIGTAPRSSLLWGSVRGHARDCPCLLEINAHWRI